MDISWLASLMNFKPEESPSETVIEAMKLMLQSNPIDRKLFRKAEELIIDRFKWIQKDQERHMSKGDEWLIWIAIRMGSMAAKNEAIEVATHEMKPMIYNESKRRKGTYADKELEDYEQEARIAIAENIERYDPTFRLSTFLVPRLRERFFEFYGSSGFGRTKYSNEIASKVNRAMRELQNDGNDNPTAMEILRYINVNEPENRQITITQVENSIKYNISTTYLDDLPAEPSSLNSNPELEYLKKEKEHELDDFSNRLLPTEKEIFNLIRAWHENTDYLLTSKEIYEILQKNHVDDQEKQSIFTQKYIESALQHIRDQLMHIYRRSHHRPQMDIVNNYKADIEQLEQEEDDIINDFFSDMGA